VAIFGGLRGTELIERLFAETKPMLTPGGELAVELDEEEQAAPWRNWPDSSSAVPT